MMQIELMKLWDSDRKTVVFVTHSVDEAVFLSDRVVMFGGSPGRIVADLAIDLPHPRWTDDEAIKTSAKFIQYRNDIWRLLKRQLSEMPGRLTKTAFSDGRSGPALGDATMDDRDFGFGTASRRDFIASLAAALARHPCVPSFAGSAEAATTIQRIDMHHHFLPQHYMAERPSARRSPTAVPPSFLMQWTAAAIDRRVGQGGRRSSRSLRSRRRASGTATSRSGAACAQWNEAAAQDGARPSDALRLLRAGAAARHRRQPRKRSSMPSARSRPTASISCRITRASGWAIPLSRRSWQSSTAARSVVYVHPTFSPCCTNNMVPSLVAQMSGISRSTPRVRSSAS